MIRAVPCVVLAIVGCGAPATSPVAPAPATAPMAAAPSVAAAPAPAPPPLPAVVATPTPAAALLALSKRDHTLAIVDPVTLHVVARLPVGDDPHEVIASEDGAVAYVSNYGFGALKTLAVLDLVAQLPRPAIDLGGLRGPHGLTAVGGKIWFTAEAAKAIGRLDPATGQIDWVMGTGQDRTHMLNVSADQKRVVTANVSSGTMTILDQVPPGPDHPPPPPPTGDHPGPPPGPHGAPGGDWRATQIAVGHGPEGFDVTPDGTQVWVANAKEGTISVIDPATKKVTHTIAAGLRGANRLRFTPDGKHALISGRQPDVAVFAVATRTLEKKIPIGHGGAGIVMQPDGARAYVACGPDDYVAVIDLATLTMVGKVDVGGEPDGLAWAVRK